MDILRRAKERLESRRQTLVDLGYIATLLLPASLQVGCYRELKKQLALLKEGYGPSKLADALIDLVDGSPQCFAIIFDELKRAGKKDLTSYIDGEYLTDLANELDYYQFDCVNPGNSAWMTLYFESKIAILEARYETASRAFNSRL